MCFSPMRLCSPPQRDSPAPELSLCGGTVRGGPRSRAAGQRCPHRQAGSQSRHFYLLITPGSHLGALGLSGSQVRKLTGSQDACRHLPGNSNLEQVGDGSGGRAYDGTGSPCTGQWTQAGDGHQPFLGGYPVSPIT